MFTVYFLSLVTLTECGVGCEGSKCVWLSRLSIIFNTLVGSTVSSSSSFDGSIVVLLYSQAFFTFCYYAFLYIFKTLCLFDKFSLDFYRPSPTLSYEPELECESIDLSFALDISYHGVYATIGNGVNGEEAAALGVFLDWS